ncbi:MAG: 2-phosphosulfolactate phosphatase [Candidatus Bathyarchaeota archaeon]|nr:MAG: 2-phosphosulfolactate phosphatase [Candidatus Bathyarchaeota archaeon]
MEIRRLSTVSGAAEARGLAVIIDVFRAFTTAAHVIANGASRIVPVGTVGEAFELRQLHPDWVLMGERGGIKVEGFDYGNSPYEVSRVDFKGRTVVQTTGAGTQGVVNALGADELLLGSFVMAGAIVEHIRKDQPGIVSLVAMGNFGVEPNEEDESCAEYIEDCLRGSSPDFEAMRRRIRVAPSGAKFFDPSKPQFREEDFHLALELDRFDFFLRVVKGDPLTVVRVHP